MPKTLVLFHSRSGRSAALADAIVEGARSVRFAEVDVRRLEDPSPAAAMEGDADWGAARYRTLEGVERLADYDAIVLGGPTAPGGAAPAVLARLLEEAASTHGRALVDKVGSAFTPTTPTTAGPGDDERTPWPILAAMARLGMILVPTAPAAAGAADPAADDEMAAARRLGQRVATVADWVRHAKGHAHGHAHGHGHDHGHSHAHPHSH